MSTAESKAENRKEVERLEPGEAPDFVSLLRHLGGGTINVRLTERLREMAEMLDAVGSKGTGKAKGSITVKLDFSYEAGVTDITAKVDAKIPDFPLRRSIAWISKRGNFTASDPNQIDMFPQQPRDVTGD